MLEAWDSLLYAVNPLITSMRHLELRGHAGDVVISGWNHDAQQGSNTAKSVGFLKNEVVVLASQDNICGIIRIFMEFI